MPSYKDMYYLVMRQTNNALRLLHEAKIDKIYTAIDLLETAHRDAEAMYLDMDNSRPFVRLHNVKTDDENESNNNSDD